MNSEQEAVLAAFKQMQQAMIAKDIAAMRSLVTEDKTFTHMSGKTQTKEAFFQDIQHGVLNYYAYDIKHLDIVVKGETAILKADTTLTAKVYGMRGRWTLATVAHFIKRDGQWLQCNG